MVVSHLLATKDTTNNPRFREKMITFYLTLPQYNRPLLHRVCHTNSTLQEDPGKSTTVNSQLNNEDDASDLLDVCVDSPFKASSYSPIGPVSIQHTGSLIQLCRGWSLPNSLPLLVLTLPEPPSPGSSTHAPEAEVLPSGSSRDLPQLSNVERVSPPQQAEPEERLNTTGSSRGLSWFNKWLPVLQRNKDSAVDQPVRSHSSDPQSRSQSPTRVNGRPSRMATAQRQPVSTLGLDKHRRMQRI